METPVKPVARGGVPLSEGAKNVPGSSRYRALQKAPHGHETVRSTYTAAFASRE
jgi:hypothetical protein